MRSSRVFDGVTDPVIDYFSDKTPGPFGRRKPYIGIGALGVVLPFSIQADVIDYDQLLT